MPLRRRLCAAACLAPEQACSLPTLCALPPACGAALQAQCCVLNDLEAPALVPAGAQRLQTSHSISGPDFLEFPLIY